MPTRTSASCGPSPASAPLVTPMGRWTNLNATGGYSLGIAFGALADDPVDGYVVLFGGENTTAYVNQTWVFNGSAWSELTPANSPSPRELPAMSWDPVDGYVLLFGGDWYDSTNTQHVFGDTWSFVGGVWTSHAVRSGPAPATAPDLAYSPSEGGMVLFGGYNASLAYFSVTWLYAGGSWTQLHPASSPPARADAALVEDTADGSLLMFGGVGSGASFNDTWRYASHTWTNISPTASPPARWGTSHAWDPVDGCLLMQGGIDGTSVLHDTWAFCGGAWVHPSLSLDPGPRWGTGSAWDSTLQFFVVYSGINYLMTGTQYADTWAFLPSVRATPNAVPAPSEVGVPVSFTANGAGGSPPYSYSWSFGDGGTSTVTNPSHTYSSSGNFLVNVTITDRASATSIAQYGLSVHPAVTVQVGAASHASVGQNVKINATAVGGVGPFSYAWQFTGGATASGASVSLPFASAGSYTATVTVTDALGIHGSGTTSFTVARTLAVTIVPSATSVAPGGAILFRATPTGGWAPFTYAWVFGDGGTATGANTTHTFAVASTYSVQVTISDSNGGTNQSTVSIDVATPSSSSSGLGGVSGLDLALIGVVIAVVIAAAVLFLVMRKRRGGATSTSAPGSAAMGSGAAAGPPTAPPPNPPT